jgi:cytochrome c-type biogenesis protein CcmH
MRAFLAAILLALSLVQAASAAPEKLANPAQEARAVALQKQLRCLVCQGESLDDSNAPLAADLRQLIREQIAAGRSDDAVKHYLVARYGDFILMKPPMEGQTYLLWFAPLLVLFLGGGVVAVVAVRAGKRAATEEAAGDHVLGSGTGEA